MLILKTLILIFTAGNILTAHNIYKNGKLKTAVAVTITIFIISYFTWLSIAEELNTSLNTPNAIVGTHSKKPRDRETDVSILEEKLGRLQDQMHTLENGAPNNGQQQNIDKLLSRIKELEANNNQTQLIPDQSNRSNIDISGYYTFSKGNGVATVTQSGNDVQMYWTYKPRNAPEPHYEINVKRNGLLLSGNYICLVKGLRGCGTVYRINFKIDPSGNKIVATEGEDPTRHGITNGFTLYRKR